MIAAFLLATTPVVEDTISWRNEATQNDVERVARWEEALKLGREGAVQGGHAGDIASRAPLFDTDIGQQAADIPAGLYNCSVTKLDGKPDAGLPYIAYPAFKCRVVDHDGKKHFIKLTGSQRTIGWIYPDDRAQHIYLGSLIYGYEDALIPYGRTAERDQAGVLQRIGDRRWRMVFPYPYYESVVDVMELTPAR